MATNNKVISHFLSGLIDGDGHIGARGFEFTSSSKELIEGVDILMLKLGIKPRISKTIKYAKNTTNRIRRPYNRLSIFDSVLTLRAYNQGLKFYMRGTVCSILRAG